MKKNIGKHNYVYEKRMNGKKSNNYTFLNVCFS